MPINEKKKITNKRYTDKCDNINLRPIMGKGQEIRAAAAAAGESLQGYILKAIEQRMQSDNAIK